METLWSILGSSALTAAILATFGFIFKETIGRWIAISIENHKADLQKQTAEHQTRFTRLHQDQADVVAKLYGLLIGMERGLTTTQNVTNLLLEPDRTDYEPLKSYRDKSLEHIWSNYETLKNYFDEKTLYLPEDLCERINTFLQKCDQAKTDLTLTEIPQNEPIVHPIKSLETQMRTFDTISLELPKLRDEIKQEFRKMLGFVS